MILRRWRSDVIFALTLAKRISLRSNIARRKADITEKTLAIASVFSCDCATKSHNCNSDI